jgi:hypothetical protein
VIPLREVSEVVGIRVPLTRPRAAPASPSAPIPNADQSHCSPGLKDCPRSIPAWRREFHQEISNEQRLLESMGAWCG